jgi:hypothetical protein
MVRRWAVFAMEMEEHLYAPEQKSLVKRPGSPVAPE